MNVSSVTSRVPAWPAPSLGTEATLSEARLAGLFDLIRQEEEKALALFSLYVDKATMPQVACRARLNPPSRIAL